MSKLLVIIGATGNQGGSVIKSILADPNASKQFKLRGVTRDVSKDAAKALTAQGVEMVAADLGDKASLVKAFEGAYGVYAVTDFWATMDKDTEVKQGKNMADAAKENNVQHYVCSSLIDTTKSTGGKLSKIDHFVGKAEIGAYAKSLGLPTTLFMAGYYNSNLPNQQIIKTPNGYIVPSPADADSKWPMFDAANDTGKFVKAIFLNKEKTLGKDIYGAEKYYTPVEVAQAFEEAFPVDGKGTQYVPVKGEDFVKTLKGYGMSDKIAEEMLENMYLLNKEYGYYAGADLKESLSILSEPPTTLVEFFKNEPTFAGLK